MLFEQQTHKIIGCAMKVHTIIGNGFQEVIYQRALAIELKYEKINFTREHEMKIYYRDEEIGTRRVDFFIEENIMVELKAISHLEDIHLAQAMNYLEAYKLPIGLLINFGVFPKLSYERFVCNPRNPSAGKYEVLANRLEL